MTNIEKPSKLTVSFAFSSLGRHAKREELYAEIFKELTKTVSEDDVIGIQLYPADWPRKVQITVKDEKTKERLVIEGISLSGNHIEMHDEGPVFNKVTIKDLPIEWPDYIIRETLNQYGEVVRIESEKIIVDGRQTQWVTGTRFAYISNLQTALPKKTTVTLEKQIITLSLW